MCRTPVIHTYNTYNTGVNSTHVLHAYMCRNIGVIHVIHMFHTLIKHHTCITGVAQLVMYITKSQNVDQTNLKMRNNNDQIKIYLEMC